jgi:hypothetical protein
MVVRSRRIFSGGSRFAFLSTVFGFFALSVFTGCTKTKLITDPILGPDYHVSNVFRKEAALPAQIRRVAVLPLTTDTSGPSGVSGRETLEPVLHTELAKAGRFELIFLKPLDLQKWTGKERWDYVDVLPTNLLQTIAARTDADGVLFARLSRYHAYPPMVIGWRLTLTGIDADVLWSADAVFDAAEEPVSNSARRYDRGHVRNRPVLEDSRSILLSPSKFGQYTANAVVQTLPKR